MLKIVWTIGHSNRELAEFIGLLTSESIELVADVRRFPGSRRHPHFSGDALHSAIAPLEIEYRHFPALGGRRTERAPGSPNTAWRVDAFNAYADYMRTSEFREEFNNLEAIAAQRRTAIMCAEALPWRCHRRLIADFFVARGWDVLDIVGPKQIKEHSLPEFAQVHEGMITYVGETLF
jgi:uncharacterized protein (DUF488 family)